MPASLTKALVDRIPLGLFGKKALAAPFAMPFKPAPVPERLPRSLTTEGCQSSFADRRAHMLEMEKIQSLRIAGAAHFADPGIKDIALRSINSKYSATLLSDEQRTEGLIWRKS